MFGRLCRRGASPRIAVPTTLRRVCEGGWAPRLQRRVIAFQRHTSSRPDRKLRSPQRALQCRVQLLLISAAVDLDLVSTFLIPQQLDRRRRCLCFFFQAEQTGTLGLPRPTLRRGRRGPPLTHSRFRCLVGGSNGSLHNGNPAGKPKRVLCLCVHGALALGPRPLRRLSVAGLPLFGDQIGRLRSGGAFGLCGG